MFLSSFNIVLSGLVLLGSRDLGGLQRKVEILKCPSRQGGPKRFGTWSKVDLLLLVRLGH